MYSGPTGCNELPTASEYVVDTGKMRRNKNGDARSINMSTFRLLSKDECQKICDNMSDCSAFDDVARPING